jgi:hypothetical protein
VTTYNYTRDRNHSEKAGESMTEGISTKAAPGEGRNDPTQRCTDIPMEIAGEGSER